MTAPRAPTGIAQTASLASHVSKAVSGADRDAALTAIHDVLEANTDAILAANRKDMSAASDLITQGKLNQSLGKRLDLSKPGKWEDMLSGISQVKSLPNPVGKATLATKLDNGLGLYRVTSPIGVLLVIFEARPEVIANGAEIWECGDSQGWEGVGQQLRPIAKVVGEALGAQMSHQGQCS